MQCLGHLFFGRHAVASRRGESPRHNFLYCAGKFSGGELWLLDAGAVSKEGSRQHRPQPFTWQDDSNPEGLPGFKISAKERTLGSGPQRTSVGAYTVCIRLASHWLALLCVLVSARTTPSAQLRSVCGVKSGLGVLSLLWPRRCCCAAARRETGQSRRGSESDSRFAPTLASCWSVAMLRWSSLSSQSPRTL